MTRSSRPGGGDRHEAATADGGPTGAAGDLAFPHENTHAPATTGANGAAPLADRPSGAVRAPHGPFSPESEARVCELIMGDRRHGL
ncbi:hypothetical protein [Streptomyces pristinaespiralis]|uniref:hypothetical protein n=1 Tax=Streptomyces pristinaespiralis TaxID=38300 RepID=UPI0038329276